jgi:hypothetical protein
LGIQDARPLSQVTDAEKRAPKNNLIHLGRVQQAEMFRFDPTVEDRWCAAGQFEAAPERGEIECSAAGRRRKQQGAAAQGAGNL